MEQRSDALRQCGYGWCAALASPKGRSLLSSFPVSPSLWMKWGSLWMKPVPALASGISSSASFAFSLHMETSISMSTAFPSLPLLPPPALSSLMQSPNMLIGNSHPLLVGIPSTVSFISNTIVLPPVSLWDSFQHPWFAVSLCYQRLPPFTSRHTWWLCLMTTVLPHMKASSALFLPWLGPSGYTFATCILLFAVQWRSGHSQALSGLSCGVGSAAGGHCPSSPSFSSSSLGISWARKSFSLERPTARIWEGWGGVGGRCPLPGAVGQPDAATEAKLQVQVLIEPVARGNFIPACHPGYSHSRDLPKGWAPCCCP